MKGFCMRSILFFSLILTSSIAYSDVLRCYANNKLVYHHQGQIVNYREGAFMFVEAGTERLVVSSLPCVGKLSHD